MKAYLVMEAAKYAGVTVISHVKGVCASFERAEQKALGLMYKIEENYPWPEWKFKKIADGHWENSMAQYLAIVEHDFEE